MKTNVIYKENSSQEAKFRPYFSRLLTNCNLYAYGANNPVHYIDPDGRSLFSEAKAWMKHPIAASKVGRASDGGKNISSIATNFTINLGLPWANYGEGRRDEGSARGSFRHTFWQALISRDFGCKTPDDIGQGHDPIIPQLQESYNNLSDADTMVDNLNNMIGRSLGSGNKKTNTELAKDVLDFQHDFGLYSVTKNDDGTYGIGITKLSDAEYSSAIKKLQNLNESGLNR